MIPAFSARAKPTGQYQLWPEAVGVRLKEGGYFTLLAIAALPCFQRAGPSLGEASLWHLYAPHRFSSSTPRPSAEGKVVRVLNAQPTGWLAKHAAKCLRRTLLDDLGFRKLPHLPRCCHLGHLLNELRGPWTSGYYKAAQLTERTPSLYHCIQSNGRWCAPRTMTTLSGVRAVQGS
jgi:hypothetical protein